MSLSSEFLLFVGYWLLFLLEQATALQQHRANAAQPREEYQAFRFEVLLICQVSFFTLPVKLCTLITSRCFFCGIAPILW